MNQQNKNSTNRKKKKPKVETMISTGSTLLDLAISGSIVRGGGIPGGVLVEIFGPAGCGKTVLLCEIAGNIHRQNGGVMFRDPEARLNKQFARLFGLEVDKIDYSCPNTIPELFLSVRDWDPEAAKIHGVFADSLAALSTDMEMDKEEGDKMGMRRAKEFSEELRRTCRIIKEKNYLMVCSNQVRVNVDAGQFGQKYTSPGGEAIGFYSSIRLRAQKPQKIQQKRKIAGTEQKKVTGVEVQLEVFKNSIAKPYEIAPLTITFDYGIDDIRENLKFLKTNTNATTYCLADRKLDKSIEESIRIIEEEDLEEELRNEVIDLWEEIQKKFASDRKPKKDKI